MICWAGAFQIFAQGTQTTPVSADTSQFHTIFHKGDGTHKIPLGYFIELNGGYSHLGHGSAFLPGMSMGIILDHHWTVGMTGNFMASSHGYHHHGENDSIAPEKHHHSSTVGGYGGLLLEYTLFPQSRVHVSFPLTIGGGYLVQAQQMHPGDSAYSHNSWSHYSFSHGDGFFVLEPGVKLELNVIKNLRVGLGVSYRYSPDMDHHNTSPEVIDQFTVRLGLRFGKF